MLSSLFKGIGKATKFVVEVADEAYEDIKNIPDAFSEGYNSEEEPKTETGKTDEKKEDTKTPFSASQN